MRRGNGRHGEREDPVARRCRGYAAASGLGAYPNGAEAFAVGVVPPPRQELHADFSASRVVADGPRLGMSGFAYRITDDEYHPGADVPLPVRELPAADVGNRSRVLAADPDPWHNWHDLFLELRNQWDFAARNKTEGVSHWFTVTGASRPAHTIRRSPKVGLFPRLSHR
ncbi:MAG: hypothetical protein JW781_08705 [Deltaproteobacteria bacterium]|nr:hypothetical protein [Candidatus Anaeroferrophillacea bacterium]